ncbi:hypothetical protein E2C01_054130 [Portunus trituberculatus]|uniref:Uncharacterized protein n=1 Tax=Portunus trituberculatus TaxID=210409 RepID=A0A5B7GR41_PORTR|nr:hypothetical protein [Portunus trituberculatus]
MGKLNKIWSELEEPFNIESCRRQVRDKVHGKTSKLKDSGAPYERVFVKRDVHPSVRNEWKRLRDAEAAERAKPQNTGCVIKLDTRARKLYRDVIIDSWRQASF